MNGSDVLDGPQQQLVCVVQLPIALAAEQVRAAWARALDSDPLAQPCYSRAKCGEVEQRQCMRTIVTFALAGKPLTQQLANHVNGSMELRSSPRRCPPWRGCSRTYFARKHISGRLVSRSSRPHTASPHEFVQHFLRGQERVR